MIVPYGFYSLREVFDKFGKAVFEDLWDGEEVNLPQNLKDNSTVGYPKLQYLSLIYPLTDEYCIENIKGFLESSYNEESFESLVKSFLSNHYETKCAVREDLIGREKAEKTPSLVSGIRIPITIPEDLGVEGEKDSQKELKRDLIKAAIKYWAVIKDLKRILYNRDIEGYILDEETANSRKIEGRYWLANNSKYDLVSSKGSYVYYSSGYKRQRNGLILFHKKAVDENIDRIFKKEKNNENKGRKSKVDWDKFSVEAFKRLRNLKEDELPKQDYLAELMKDWCSETFGKEVGLSTVKAKLKPFYDIVKSEKSA